MRASSDPGLRLPKPPLKKKARGSSALERSENKKVKERSQGICEVVVKPPDPCWGRRCVMDATQIHHLYGGWKLRGKGRSALAIHKLHVCTDHHRRITGDVGVKLKRIGGPVPLWSDPYRSV